MSFNSSLPYLFIYSISGLSILFSLILAVWLVFRPFNEKKIGEVILHSRKGLFFYCLRHFSLVAISSFVISSFLYQLFNVTNAVGFLLGVFGSLLIGYVSLVITYIAALRGLHSSQQNDGAIQSITQRSLLSIGFLSVGALLAGITGFYQYGQDIRALLSLGLGVAFIGLVTKLSFSLFAQSLVPTSFDRRSPALYAQFIALQMRGAVREVVALFEVSALSLITSLILGLHFFSNAGQAPHIFLVTAMLLSLGLLAALIGGILVTLQPIRSLFTSLQRVVAYTSVLTAVLLVSLYQFLGLPAEFYNRNIFLVFFAGIIAVDLLLLLLHRVTSSDWEDTIAVNEIRFSSSFVTQLLLISILLLISLLLVPGYGLVILLVSLFSLIVFLPLMGSSRVILQSVYELSAIIPASRRVQNEIKTFIQENELMPTFQKNYQSLIVVIISLITITALSSQQVGNVGLGTLDTKMITGIFAGGAGVYFLAQVMGQSILSGISLVESEIERLFKKVRPSKKETVLPDYEAVLSRISFYTYRRLILPIGLPVAVVFVGGIILGAQFLAGLMLGSLLCGIVFMFANRAQESVQEVVGLTISSLIFLTGFISLLLISFF